MYFCCFFFFFSSQCVRDGCGSDASLFLLRIQGLASYQHELPRAEKLISMLNLILEGGPWRKGRDCYFHYCTLWQSFGLLRSKSWELVSGKIVIMLFMSFLLTINVQTATIKSLAFLMLGHMITRVALPSESITYYFFVYKIEKRKIIIMSMEHVPLLLS